MQTKTKTKIKCQACGTKFNPESASLRGEFYECGCGWSVHIMAVQEG